MGKLTASRSNGEIVQNWLQPPQTAITSSSHVIKLGLDRIRRLHWMPLNADRQSNMSCTIKSTADKDTTITRHNVKIDSQSHEQSPDVYPGRQWTSWTSYSQINMVICPRWTSLIMSSTLTTHWPSGALCQRHRPEIMLNNLKGNGRSSISALGIHYLILLIDATVTVTK